MRFALKRGLGTELSERRHHKLAKGMDEARHL
jgi:hypothetical protein